MLLTIDVGNTNMVFGIYEDAQSAQLQGKFRLSTDDGLTSDEMGLRIIQYYRFHHLDPADTDAVIIASVVPPVMHSLKNAIRKYFQINPIIVGKDVDCGIVNKYDNPKEVGIDRLVNVVSALPKYGAPMIIVDIGTAITFDCVDATGAYLGGAIFPGIRVAMEALFIKASKLPRVDIVRPETAIGRTTVQSMQSGAVRGYVGAMNGIIAEMKQELGEDVKVIATGGMGRMMADYCPVIDAVEPKLTLEGMRLIYVKNQQMLGNRRMIVCEEDEAL